MEFPFIGHGRFGVVIIAITILLLAACNAKPEPPLRIGSNVWPGYEPLYLARDLGYYDETQIHLVELTSASDVIYALRNDALDAAALTLDETLMLIDEGYALSVILVMDFSDGADALLVKPEITSLAQLRGKRIAVEDATVGAILLDAALKAAGLEVADVEIVSCMINNHIECYDLVDAVVSFGQVKTQLQQRGGRVLFDSSQIHGRIVDVMVVQNKIMESQQQNLRRLIKGYYDALASIASKPQDAALRMSARLQLNPAQVLPLFDGLRIPGLAENFELLSGNPSPLEHTALDLSELMFEHKLIANRLGINRFSSARYLPESK